MVLERRLVQHNSPETMRVKLIKLKKKTNINIIP